MRTVVFVCQHGAAKSVLAAATLDRIARGSGLAVESRAFGTDPEAHVSPAVIALVPDRAAQLERHRPEPVDERALAAAWRIVTFGVDPASLPIKPPDPAAAATHRLEAWDDVPAISEQPEAALAAIERHVVALLGQVEGPVRTLVSPLLSVLELAGRLDDPGLVVIDTRWFLGQPGGGRAAYDAGHIPGAIHLDLDADLADAQGFGAPGRHPLPDAEVFKARMVAAGVGDDTQVVAYDDAGGWVAARLWWMLDNLGHRGGVAVLDGGWQAWLAAGLPTSTDLTAPVTPSSGLHLGRRWSRVIARDELAARLGRLTLLDARAAARYRGETEPIDPVAGHIPTAIHAPWDGNLGPDGRFLPPDELRRRFAALADPGPAPADGEREFVTSCGSGVSACHHSLAMRIAGLPDPILYVGSYSDWSRSGMPIATGPEPGTP